MNFHRFFSLRFLPLFLMAGAVLLLGASAWADRGDRDDDDDGDDDEKVIELAESRIFIEYNSSANDLGFHVKLDGENWNRMKIVNPKRRTIYDVAGKASFGKIGITEMFFEGAEPSLNPPGSLQRLLTLFPEGEYKFSGETIQGDDLVGKGELTHAVPAGPEVSTVVGANNSLVIKWTEVKETPVGFPEKEIKIAGYQVILDSFQVTLPADARSVTVPPEFVASLERGPDHPHGFEVLAIEEGGNQTITAGEVTL